MQDEMFHRMYQHGRAGLNRDIDAAGHKLAKALGDTLRTLHRIEWGAPWAKPSPPANWR